YMKTHGSQLQFNIVDSQTLIDAKKHPEMYKDLLVRIGGYSDFFVTIPESLQDEIISRTMNENL
ncbi:MAG: glycine radical domain-containing protein, partial [Clostridia bacterium]|nr:glycine radical domain-containing protein [Clostridia bacterium]